MKTRAVLLLASVGLALTGCSSLLPSEESQLDRVAQIETLGIELERLVSGGGVDLAWSRDFVQDACVLICGNCTLIETDLLAAGPVDDSILEAYRAAALDMGLEPDEPFWLTGTRIRWLDVHTPFGRLGVAWDESTVTLQFASECFRAAADSSPPTG